MDVGRSLNAVFPPANLPGFSYGCEGGPGFNSTIVTINSGWASSSEQWSESRIRWTLNLEHLDDIYATEIANFFRCAYGRGKWFYFRDPADFDSAGFMPIAVADVAGTVYPILKQYVDSGGNVWQRKNISIMPSDLFRLFVDNVLVTSNYSIIGTGRQFLQFAPGHDPTPGAIIAAEYTFCTPARFDTDKMAMVKEFFNENSWTNIPIIEVMLTNDSSID